MSRKRIWIDACTGKHARYATFIKRSLEAAGFEVLITTREHPDTIPMLEYLGEDYRVAGRWSYSKSPREKLKASLERQLELMQIVDEFGPDAHISFPTVEGCRVAFGLGIPILCVGDSPHAVHVYKLTVPLTDVFVTSEGIPKEKITRFGIGPERVVQFRGVDEYAWMSSYKPNHKVVDELGLDTDRPIVIIREAETRAAYYPSDRDPLFSVARRLSERAQVVFLARVREEYKDVGGRNLIIPSGFVDVASLVFFADLVISIGGTISREAALIGTPSLVYELWETEVNRYLNRLGYPIFLFNDLSLILKEAEKIIKSGTTGHERPRVPLENPLTAILREIRKIVESR